MNDAPQAMLVDYAEKVSAPCNSGRGERLDLEIKDLSGTEVALIYKAVKQINEARSIAPVFEPSSVSTPAQDATALADRIEQAIADFYPAWERKPDFARFIAAALRSTSQTPDAVREALVNCLGCVEAAEAEGLHELIVELRGSNDTVDRLIDLIDRRLLWVREYAAPALSTPSASAGPQAEAAEISAVHSALCSANIPYCAFSSDGVNLIGNTDSIKAAARAFHSHSQIDHLKTQIRHWREECGKLHAKLAQPQPADGRGECGCGIMCQDLGKEAGCRYLKPERETLRKLVDIVYQHATESEAVPATLTADLLIDRAFAAVPLADGRGAVIEAAADAIDAARYAHPDHPRERPRPFAEADRGDREYAFRLARAALQQSPATDNAPETK